MGANRPAATPEAYPAAFSSALRNGAGVFYAADIPWTPISTAKRFRLFLSLVRKRPTHPFYENAIKRWSVRPSGLALTVCIPNEGHELVSVAGPLIDAALSIGENP